MVRQKSLFQFRQYSKRKVARAVSLREYNHIVVKARTPILRLNYRIIQSVLMETQRRFGIELRAFSVMPDHAHLIVKVYSRKQWANALRFFTGQVAIRLGRGKIWAQRAWSRIVRAGRDYRGAIRYVCRNPFKAGIAQFHIDSFYIINGILFGSIRVPWDSNIQEEFSF